MGSLLLGLLFVFSAQAQNAGDEERSYNFHEIDKGKFFRSEQLGMKDFEKKLTKHAFKTIINLRGPNFKEYEAQKAMAAAHGAQYVTLGMSAKRLPHREDLLKLLEAYETGERPIYIHCKGGADRTGEASALYQMLYMNKSVKDALKMLTTRYLHFRIFYPAKSYFVKDVWKGVDWAINEYDPCSGKYKHYDVAANCSN